jgi:hypothetical protein
VRLGPLALAVAVGAVVPGAVGAAPPLRLLELPGVEALPQVPPLAPPQPPLAEVARIRGTVEARERVAVGIDAGGTPTSVRVVQRLFVRALGDYAFFIPAPAVSVAAADGSGSRPGLRPNQIVWQGFSPRRKVLAADADLRLADSVDALPLRIRVTGAPAQAGRFELALSLENATAAQVQSFTGDAVEDDVVDALRALRAAVRIGRRVEGRTVRIRGESTPTRVPVSAPLALHGTVSFRTGSVREVTPTRFSGVVGGARPATLRVTVSGEALRATSPRIRVVAEPLPAAAIPPRSVPTLDDAILGYLRYARTRQYQTFLANPDPAGPSSTTYVFETAAAERPGAAPEPEPAEDPGLPAPVVFAALALLGVGLVVLWAHL